MASKQTNKNTQTQHGINACGRHLGPAALIYYMEVETVGENILVLALHVHLRRWLLDRLPPPRG